MPIVPIVCGVLLIVGVVALFLSGTTWRWYHITIVTFVMLLSLVGFYLAARTMKIQNAWRSEVGKYETELRSEEKRHDELVKGGLDAEGRETPSLATLETDLEKMLQGRGRSWGIVALGGNVTRKSVDPATGKITAVVEPPNHGIEKNAILYLFDAADASQGGQLLGEFEVTAVNGQEVQLTPVLKLRSTEPQRIAQRRNAPLVMYEIMPTDSRDLYAEALNSLRQGVPADQKDQIDDVTLMSRVFPGAVTLEVKQEFAKDGKPAQANEPLADRIWRRVKALKEFTVPLDAAEAKAMQDAGKTVETDPVTNKPVLKIAEGAILELDPKSAQEQLAAGNVELVPEDNRIYVRQLRDYARLYRDLNLQIESVLRSTAEVAHQNAVVQDAQRKIDKDIAYRQDEIAALKSDLARFTAERSMIGRHVAALETQVAGVSAEVGKLLQENRQLEADLALLMRQAAAEINRRSQPVASDRIP